MHSCGFAYGYAGNARGLAKVVQGGASRICVMGRPGAIPTTGRARIEKISHKEEDGIRKPACSGTVMAAIGANFQNRF